MWAQTCANEVGEETVSRTFEAPGFGTACDTQGRPLTFCFTNSSSSSNGAAYAGVVLNEPWIVREVRVAQVPHFALPGNFRIEIGGEFSGDFQQFASIGDKTSGHSWTLVSPDVAVPGDLVGNLFRIFPIVGDPTVPVAMTVQLIGCRADSSEIVSLPFEGVSVRSIESRFQTVDNFLAEIKKHLCRLMFGGDSCDRVVVADLAVSESALSGKTVITLQVRILSTFCPANVYCASATAAKKSLLKDLADPASSAAKVLKELQLVVADVQPFLCANKECAAAETCIEGRCVNLEDLDTWTVAATGTRGGDAFAQKTAPLTRLRMDETLQKMHALPVIDGVPGDRDILSFQQTQSSEWKTVVAPRAASGSGSGVKIVAAVAGAVALGGLTWFFFFS